MQVVCNSDVIMCLQFTHRLHNFHIMAYSHDVQIHPSHIILGVLIRSFEPGPLAPLPQRPQGRLDQDRVLARDPGAHDRLQLHISPLVRPRFLLPDQGGCRRVLFEVLEVPLVCAAV